ncbi:MAG TPA: hypothetical protein VFE25_09345 [Opitutaceae bacterium]|jgi:hypothetical protein|nr:hypothetical protein [Opitutaceae bacterium]
MSPKYLLSLSVASVGLVLTQVSLRADDTVQPPPSGVDAPQPPPPGGHGRGREGFKLAELTAKLGLTTDQVKAIEPIIESSKSQGKAIHEDESLSPQERRAKMKGVMDSTRSQIRATLTADQQKIFDTLPMRGGKHPNGGPSEPGTPPAPPTTT